MPSDRDPGAARAVEDVGDRLHAHQHVLLGDAVGKERRVDQEGLAAELFGHLGRDVVDVGIVLALHAAGGGHDLDRVAAVGTERRDDGADALAAGDADGVAVLDQLEQQVGGGGADLLEDGLRVGRGGGRDPHGFEAGRLLEAASRSNSAWYWLRMLISTIPSSRPCLIRRLTLAWERLVSLAISAWVMPSWKCITSTL